MLAGRFLPLALVAAGLLLAGPARAGDGAVMTVSATVLSKSVCKFTSSATLLSFGSMDAALSSDWIVTGSLDFRCNGSAPIAAFIFLTDDGLFEAGVGLPRMRHATVPAEYLPYRLDLSPASGTIPKGAVGTLTLTGTVTSANLASAISGSFADTVTVTLLP